MEIYSTKNIFQSFLLVISIIIIYKCSRINSDKLEGNYRYTIAEITKKGVDAEGAFYADIEYYINHKKYSSSFSIMMEENKNYLLGAKYFIKYYPVDPNISKAELELVIPKSIKSAPPEGWKELPIN